MIINKKKGFLITTAWMLIIAFITLFLMMMVLFYSGYTLYSLSKTTLLHPEDTNYYILNDNIENCFSYYDPYTFTYYPYLFDINKFNKNNLTNCMDYPVEVILNLEYEKEGKKLVKQVKTDKFNSADKIFGINVIVYNSSTNKRYLGKLILQYEKIKNDKE